MPFSQLSADIRTVLDTLMADELVSRRTLKTELDRYTRTLYVRAEIEEHFDTRTALATIKLAERLLSALPEDAEETHHRITQVALRYFVLEEDADSDAESMVGFDDDLAVVEAAAAALGVRAPRD